MDFINKLYVKAIFSEDSNLNIVPSDLGENMIKLQSDGRVVNRLPAATGTVGSLSIFLPISAEFQILKTSPAYRKYYDRCLANGYLGGTCTIYDDVNERFEISEISVSFGDIPEFAGTQPYVVFLVEGNLLVNTQALAGI